MQARQWVAIGVLTIAGGWPLAAAAQDALIDAGGQAMLMHQGALLEQQTTGGAKDKRRARRGKPNATCDIAGDRERLRANYERRVRSDGRQAADAWLRGEAAALGRTAGTRARTGARC